MQYRLHWLLVPLTRSFPPSPVFGYFQYHRAQGDAQAMKISQCISKDLRCILVTVFTILQIQESSVIPRALKNPCKIVPPPHKKPHNPPAVGPFQIQSVKGILKHLPWHCHNSLDRVWIIVTVCTAGRALSAVADQPCSLFPPNTGYTLCKGALRKGLVYLRKTLFLQEIWPFQGVISMYSSE